MGTEYGYGRVRSTKKSQTGVRKRYGYGIILKHGTEYGNIYGLYFKAGYGIRKYYGVTSICLYGYGIRIVIGTSESAFYTNHRRKA